MKIKKVQLNSRVPTALASELKLQARLRNTTESLIVESALKTFLGQTEHQAVIDKRLNKLQKQLDDLAREQQLTLETLATFAKVYLIHTPEIPNSQKEQAEDFGMKRFNKFIQLISKALSSRRLFRDAVDDQIMEESDWKQPQA